MGNLRKEWDRVVGKSERLTSSICSSALLNCDVLIASTSNLRSLIPDSDKQHSLKIARREKTDCLCNMARLNKGFSVAFAELRPRFLFQFVPNHPRSIA
jgi:hypothetical protein